MSTPNSPLNGQGHELDLVTLPGGTAMLKLGVGTQSVTSSTTDAAWQGVATHEGGAAVGASDGLVVVAGVNAGDATPLAVDASGNLTISSASASSATRSNVSAAAADTSLLASNAARRGATVYNDSAAVLYLGLGTTAASTTNYTVQVAAGGYYEVPFGFTGAIRGIWASATGTARITELS